MHKKPRILPALLIAALLLLLASPTLVSAQGDGFQETFDNPNLEEWEYSPEVTVTDGVLTLPSGSFALRPGDWSEITLSVKMKYAGEGEVLINYYFRDRNTYGLILTTGLATLQKEKDGTPSQLGSAAAPVVQPDTWINIKITVSGGDHQVYLNDELLLTATDSEPLETGAILLHALGGVTVEFDDLNVRGTPGDGPPPGEEAPPAGEEPQPGGKTARFVPGRGNCSRCPSRSPVRNGYRGAARRVLRQPGQHYQPDNFPDQSHPGGDVRLHPGRGVYTLGFLVEQPP